MDLSPFAQTGLTIVGIILLTLVLIYWHGIHGYRILQRMNIPGPKPLPYIGNLPEIIQHGGLHLAYAEFMKKYGKVYGLCIGRTGTVVVAEPEMLKSIMVKDFQYFKNRDTVQIPLQNEFLRKGLFHSQDELWKKNRTTLTPTFTSGKLRHMTPLMEKSCDILERKLREVADTGKSVDVQQWFNQISLEIILSTVFGIDSNVQENPDNEFASNVKMFLEVPDAARKLMALPFSGFLTKIYLLYKNHEKYLIDMSTNIIEARKRGPSVGRKDLVEIMLSAKNPDGSRKLSDEEIIAQAINFLVAGHETTSNTLSSVAYYLALNPEVQDRLRQEIRSAIESNPDTPPMELANDLEYLDCVVNETLRIQPPAYMTNRECQQDYYINGVTIPKGMQVIVPIYALHHDPDAWPEPDKFDPERFRGPAKDSRHPFQFQPFGEGPRICIGMRFAAMEYKLTLFKVLSKFKFVRCPETQVPLAMIGGITLMPRDDIYLKVETS